jgi:hypothetical protein
MVYWAMDNELLIYMDCCCLNRLADDQTQDRIRIESSAIQNRALEVQKYGLKSMDSLHFASAEYRNVDVLLTVDKDFIKFSKKINTSLVVENPINWFMEEIK